MTQHHQCHYLRSSLHSTRGWCVTKKETLHSWAELSVFNWFAHTVVVRAETSSDNYILHRTLTITLIQNLYDIHGILSWSSDLQGGRFCWKTLPVAQWLCCDTDVMVAKVRYCFVSVAESHIQTEQSKWVCGNDMLFIVWHSLSEVSVLKDVKEQPTQGRIQKCKRDRYQMGMTACPICKKIGLFVCDGQLEKCVHPERERHDM